MEQTTEDKAPEEDVQKAIRETLFKILESINILIDSVETLSDGVVKLVEGQGYEFDPEGDAEA